MHKREAIVGFTALLLIGSAVRAQQSDDTSASSGKLEEILVTAQKRTENLQDVPVAITAVTAATLERSGISTTQNLAFIVPSLVYSRTGAYGQPYLRGIGSDITLPNADSSVTTYVDGVVVSSTSGLIQDLLGIERVEVALGPQGTLNGRNATAGAISIYTLTPSETPEARLKVGYGNYENKQVSGSISGGLGENLAVGFYGAFTDRDSYLDQLGDGRAPSSERSRGGRIKAVYSPSDSVHLTGSIEYTKSDSMEAGAFRNVQDPNLGVTLGVPNAVQSRYDINTGPDSNSGLTAVNNTTYAATLREEVDLGWSKILGITGYRNLKSEQGNDLDGTPLAIADAVALNSRSKQFSQEVQLLSPDDSKIKWIAGLYYLREKAGMFPLGILSDVIFPAPINGAWNETYVTLNSYAAFAQFTAPLTEGLSLTVGGRYTEDKKEWKANGWFSTGASYDVIPGTFTDFPTDDHTFSNFTPKVTLDYKLSDAAMVYATFARGYKAGAYNLAAPSNPMPSPVDPEKLDDYEVGIKAQMLDDRLRLNASGYFYDYSDIQTQTNDGSGGATTLQNAASAELYGVELSSTAVVTSQLRLNGSVAWQSTKYKSFPNASSFALTPLGNPTQVFDVSGNATPRAPKWVGSLGAEYDYTLPNGGTLNLSTNALYNDGFYWESTNRFEQDSYTVINAQAAYTFPTMGLTISLWGTNLTDEYYSTAFQILPTAVGVMDAPPRMYGLSLQWQM